jgi:branched-subunit amino acid ABC-type transport system permease component
VNFAHGEFLTFGAYMMIAAEALDVPLILAALFGVVATAAFGLSLEVAVWRPVRRRRVGELQLLLLALGLAFVIRNATDSSFPSGATGRCRACGVRRSPLSASGSCRGRRAA